jgi:hypothetical protein
MSFSSIRSILSPMVQDASDIDITVRFH